jgi:DNA-binding transcriptional ArsR family regulator
LRVLVSTFGVGDLDKVLLAMKHLPYDRLVLMGDRHVEESDDFSKIRDLEAMTNHGVTVEIVDDDGFMELVNSVSEVLQRHARDPGTGARNALSLNISGGRKLLGDAALFAAFRSGVGAYHCDGKLVRLPVVQGATAIDRFTPLQAKFIASIGEDWVALGKVMERMQAVGKSATERVIRELRKAGLLRSEVRSGEVRLSLTDQGREVLRAIRIVKRD